MTPHNLESNHAPQTAELIPFLPKADRRFAMKIWDQMSRWMARGQGWIVTDPADDLTWEEGALAYDHTTTHGGSHTISIPTDVAREAIGEECQSWLIEKGLAADAVLTVLHDDCVETLDIYLGMLEELLIETRCIR